MLHVSFVQFVNKMTESTLNFLKFSSSGFVDPIYLGFITVYWTTYYSICHQNNNLNTEEFVDASQIPEVIVTGMENLSYMIVK